jgi:putative phosphoribosyl transferase
MGNRSRAAAPFRDRVDAGQQLAHALAHLAGQPQTLVLALPRGGVPVAAEVAQALRLPLELCLVRKLGVPEQPELAMGAIALQGVRVLNREVIHQHQITAATIDHITALETAELQRRNRTYRPGRGPLKVTGQRLILVDDGVATGSTLRAAIALLQPQAPQQIVVAVPVAPPETVAQLSQLVDRVVCLVQPEPFRSLSLWYRSFDQTSDATVCALLQANWASSGH